MSQVTEIPGVASADILAAHLQEIIVEYEDYRHNCGRSERREQVSIPVEALKLNDDFDPISAPFHMITRDISVGGCGLFHTEELDCNYLQLKFESPISQESFGVIASVEHCTRCGVFQLVGCRFLAD